MILMFHKKEKYGKYFEDTKDFTVKVPPSTAYVWNEEIGEWIMPESVTESEPEPEPEIEAEESE